MNSVILEIAYKCSAIASVDLNGIPLRMRANNSYYSYYSY